jgi:putative ABC transport system ATP-binding protein
MSGVTAPVLALDDAGRSFDGGRIVGLDGVTLAFAPGELVAIHGASGSGKSTLINLISGLDRPTSGKVIFDGTVSPTRSEWTRLRARRIGLVFQDFNLIPTLTAVENVETAMFGIAGKRKTARERLDEVGVGYCAARKPTQMSGGERRRVAIARGLANQPEVLLADEPTSNLDSVSGAAVIELFLSLHARGGMTTIIVTHDRPLIERCGRRILMSDGRVAADERRAA